MLKLELAEDGRACGGRTKVKRKRGIIEERGREGEGGREREGGRGREGEGGRERDDGLHVLLEYENWHSEKSEEQRDRLNDKSSLCKSMNAKK